MAWNSAPARIIMEPEWEWHRGIYHLLGHEKRRWKALQHPNFAGWHWGMEPEPSSEGFEMDTHNSCNTIFPVRDISSELEMDQRPPLHHLRGSTELLKKQAEELSRMTAKLQRDLLKKAQEGYGSIHFSTTDLNFRLPPGFPPPLPQLQSARVEAQQFNSRATQPANQPHPFALQVANQHQVVAHQAQAFAQAIASPSPTSPPQSEYSAPPNRLPQPPAPHIAQSQIPTRPQHQVDLHRGRATMATPAPTVPKPLRVRSLSPEDIGRLVEQARRRNASRNVTPPRLSSPQVPQIVIGSEDTSSSLVVSQYAQHGSLNHAEPPPTFALAPAHSGRLHVARSKQIDRVLGHEFGLDSNMPSQIPRNPQEAAATAARHAQRVRSMQYTLAADPNIMVHQASGSSTQLTAAGPPLTQGSATLPSVLTPYSRTSLMNYKDALQAIIVETGPLHMLLRLQLLEPAPVTVLMYDDMNRSLGVSEDLVLTKETDLTALVCLTQELLDITLTHLPGHDGQRFVIQAMDVRNGSDEMKAGHPPLKGECRGGDKVKSAAWVRWIVGGEMEQYWQALRIELQMGAPQPGDKKPVVKPIFRVKTVRQIAESDGSYLQDGHEFIDISTLKPTSGAVQDVEVGREFDDDDNGNHNPEIGSNGGQNANLSQNAGQRQYSGGEATLTSSGPADTGSRNSGGNRGINKTNFGGDAAASTPGSTNDSFSNNTNSGKAPEPSQAKEKSKTKAVDPTRNWGYYQRMGGDPCMHKLYDLSHIPFEVEDFPVPEIKFDTAVEQEIIARIQAEGWNFEEPRNSVTPKASAQPTVSAEKQAWLDNANEQFERAKGFEDDDSFFPNYDTQIPDARKIIASHLIVGQKHSAKGKGRETPGNNSMRHTDIGVSGSEVESYDVGGKGKAKQTDFNDLHGGSSSLDASQARIDRIVSRFQGTFNNSNMRQSQMGTNTPIVTKMNVHAPNFNYQQLVDRSNNISLSPYLQSLAGPQPAYTQPNPYGMIGKTASSAPGTQNPSATMVGNQASSIHKSNSSAGFTTFSIPTLHPQQGSSSLRNSPEKQYAANARMSPVAQFTFPQSSTFNTGAYAGSSGSSSPAFSTSRRQSPDRQYTQQGKGHGQQLRSPERLNRAGHGGVPYLRHPSPELTERFNTQHSHGIGFQQGRNSGATQMASHPSLREPSMQHGSGAGFQYGQNTQYNLEFDYQPNGQSSDHNGGQGPM